MDFLDLAKFGFNFLSQLLQHRQQTPIIFDQKTMHINRLKCNCVGHLGSIVADWNMWSSPRLHGKSHNLPFDKDEEQNKHLEKSQGLVLFVLPF